MKGISTSKLIKPLIGLAMLAGLSAEQVANATPVTTDGQFTFADLLWDATFDGGYGSIVVDDPTVGTAIINGHENDPTCTVDGANATPICVTGTRTTTMTTGIDKTGTISFDWLYNTEDSGGSFWDPFVILNDELITLYPTDGGNSGSFSIGVLLGDILTFGLGIQSDSFGGTGHVAISDFCYGPAGDPNCEFGGQPPNPVPVPGALVLFASAMAGLGFMRRRKQAVV